MLIFFTNLSLMEFRFRYLALFCVFSIIPQLWVVLDGKFSQDYQINIGVPQGSIFGPKLFLLYFNDLPDDVICDIAIYTDDTTLYSHVWWDIWSVATTRDSCWTWIWSTRHCGLGKKVVCWFQCWKKNSLLCLTDIIILVLLTWKWIGLFLMKNHILRCWGCLSLLKLDWESYIVSIARIASKKIGALICSMKFFSLRLLCISINLPYNLAWNTVAMPGLVLLAAAWIC